MRIVALATDHSTSAGILGVGAGEAESVLGRLRDRADNKAVERVGRQVAEKFDRFLDVEFRDAHAYDRDAAVGSLSEFLGHELSEPRRLVDAVRAGDELRTFLMLNGGEERATALGGVAGEIFRFLLDQAVDQVAKLAPASPQFQSAALVDLIQGMDVVLDGVSELVDRPVDGVVVEEVVAFANNRVRELVPAELRDREAQLDRMNEFALHGPGQWWGWEAPMQAGKTALMATYASQRHPGVEIVPFFVRRDRAISRDRQSFLGEVCPRLARIANERYSRPVAQNPVQAEQEFQSLLRRAARACQDGPQRRQLLLLIDGLDEDDWYVDPGRGAGSIVGLLPAQLPENVRVMVACRPNPPLPEDLIPGDEASPEHRHPLRDRSMTGPWHMLEVSPHARQAFDRNDVVDFMSSQVGRAVAAHLVAADGPLTIGNLTQLVKHTVPEATEAEVRSRITTTSGRLLIPVATDPTRAHAKGYEPGHARITQHVLTVLDPDLFDSNPDTDDAATWHAHANRLLGHWRDDIREWARSYADQQWPDTTPNYLLEQAYIELLAQDAVPKKRLVDVLTDPARHSRIHARTGSFAPALAQLHTTVNSFLAVIRHEDASSEPIDLEHIARLLFAIHDLTREFGRVPADLPAVFARAGQDRQAERLIEATENPLRALTAMARTYLDTAAHARCIHAASRALQRLTPYTTFNPDTAETVALLARLLAQAGDIDSARNAANAIPASTNDHQNTLTAAIIAHAVSRQVNHALDVAGLLDPRTRIHALEDAAWACYQTGNTADALTFATEMHDLANTLDINFDFLAQTVHLFADMGKLDIADSIATERRGSARLRLLADLAEHLLHQDERDAAGQIALQAAADLAEADPFFGGDTLSSLGAVLIETGYERDARPVLRACAGHIRSAGHARLAAAYYAAEQSEQAREHLDTALTNADQQQGWLRVYDLENLVAALIPVAPANVLAELLVKFMHGVASDSADTYVRNSGVRTAIRLARVGRVSDALHLAQQLQETHDAFANEISVAIARALAASTQWQETLNVLNSGELTAQDVTTVADALAHHGHVDLALRAANKALQTPRATRHREALTDVVRALAGIGHLPAVLEIIAEEAGAHRYDEYFWAADAATRHDRAQAIRTIESLVPEHPGMVPLLTGAANAALAEERPEDAMPLLARAAVLARQQAKRNVNAVTNIACLQAYARDPDAAVDVIRHSVPGEEQHYPLARVAVVLAETGRAEDASAKATLALSQVTSVSDVRQRIHACSSLTKLLAPYPGLSEQAQSAANEAAVAFAELRPPTSPNNDAARSTLSHDASAAATALALTGQTAAAIQICNDIRNHECEPSAFDVAPALAAGGNVSAALELIEQLTPGNQAQPLERVIAALVTPRSLDKALEVIATINDTEQRSAALNHLAAAESSQGRLDDAYRHVKEALTHAALVRPHAQSEQLLSAAGTLQQLGKRDEAKEAAFRAVASRSQISSAVLLGSARLLHGLDDEYSSRRLLAEAWVADGHPLNGWTLLAALDRDVAVTLAKRRWPTSHSMSPKETWPRNG